MKNIDLTPIGFCLESDEDVSRIHELLEDNSNQLSVIAMSLALSVCFSRVSEVRHLHRSSFEELSNKEKYLHLLQSVQGQEQELNAFILERFYRFISQC